MVLTFECRYIPGTAIFRRPSFSRGATFGWLLLSRGATFGEPLLLGGHYFPGALLSGRPPLPRGCYIREAATFQGTAAFGGPLLSSGRYF